MKAKLRQRQIKLLEKTADMISSDYYEWFAYESCTCGFVIRAMLDIDSNKLWDATKRIPRTIKPKEKDCLEGWADIEDNFHQDPDCLVCGMTLEQLIEEIHGIGLSFRELEFLTDDKVKANMPDLYNEISAPILHRTPDYVVEYLRTKARLLKEDLSNDQFKEPINSKETIFDFNFPLELALIPRLEIFLPADASLESGEGIVAMKPCPYHEISYLEPSSSGCSL